MSFLSKRSGRVGLALTLGVGLISSAAVAASPVDDDFSDGAAGPNWTTVIDAPDALTVKEQNDRLDVLSAGGGSPNNDALYLSRFRLSTASDFTIQLQYACTGYTGSAGAVGTALGVVFGVGRDEEGFDSAAIGQGFGTTSLFGFPATGPAATVGYRTGDVPHGGVPAVSLNLTGTFEIAYDATADSLTLREVGTGISQTLPGLVRGTWDADSLLVSLGGRGSDFATASGQAYVDQFRVISGNIVPEPACLTLSAIACLSLVRRRSVRF